VLDPADAVGEIEGRQEESWIRLYLRDGPGGVETAFQLQGDRSALAALSLFTCHVNGKPLASLEQVSLESLAEAYGLGEHMLPMFLPAVEVLRATLAALRGEPDPFAGDGEQICHCLNVRRGRIVRLVRERKLRTIEDVRHWTRACTGCKTCREDVEDILAGEE
jgi:NifU-like protein